MTNEKTEIIWKEFHNSLLYFIQKRIKQTEDANDILQDVFIKISKSKKNIDSSKKLTSWIYTITRNSIIDYWRANKNTIEKVASLEFDPEENIDEDNNDEIKSLKNCVNRMIRNLPEKYSVVFNLYENEKLTHQQIAERLNISISGSKTRLQRSREKLKEMLVYYCRVETDAYGNILNSCADEDTCSNCNDFSPPLEIK